VAITFLQLINDATGGMITYDQLRLTQNDSNPKTRFSQPKLVTLNKINRKKIPTLDNIRPIAMTGLIQILIFFKKEPN
jgi:hypothetical protein